MADSFQTVGGTITPTGDVVDFTIDADNPQGFIFPFGSVVTEVLFTPPFDIGGSLQTAGTITPTGELTTEVQHRCFDTPLPECIEGNAVDFDCVGACEEVITPQTLPTTFEITLGGGIQPIGQLLEQLCPECEECPPPCPESCPPDSVDAPLIQTGVHSGDLVAAMVGSEPAPLTGQWVVWSIGGAGFFQAQYRELGDFGQGGAGSGAAMNGLGYIRLQFAGSFSPPGIAMHMKRKFTGYVPGQSVGVIFKWINLNVFNVASRGQSKFTVVADGVGDIITQFDFVEAFTGILLGEFYWIESLTLLNPENPQCPE